MPRSHLNTHILFSDHYSRLKCSQSQVNSNISHISYHLYLCCKDVSTHCSAPAQFAFTRSTVRTWTGFSLGPDPDPAPMASAPGQVAYCAGPEVTRIKHWNSVRYMERSLLSSTPSPPNCVSACPAACWVSSWLSVSSCLEEERPSHLDLSRIHPSTTGAGILTEAQGLCHHQLFPHSQTPLRLRGLVVHQEG